VYVPAAVVLGKSHQSDVLDPVALRGAAGDDDALEDRGVHGELDRVVARRDPLEAFDRPVSGTAREALIEQRCQSRIEFGTDEARGKPLQDEGRAALVPAELRMLVLEDSAVIRRCDGLGQNSRRAGWVEADDVASIDRAGAEFDAGEMALAHGPHAHDEPHGALG